MIRGTAPQSPLLYPFKELKKLVGTSADGILDTWLPGFFGVSRSFLFSSGRACQFLILKALMRLAGPGRDSVIIPAYTCPTVPYVLSQAGLRILLCEVEPRSFSFDLSHLHRLVDDRTLAVMPTHLFGIPCDMEGIRETLSGKKVFIVEDFSHAIGSRYRGWMTGTLSDVGFASLGRGKLLTTWDGGIVLTSSEEISETLDSLAAEVPIPEEKGHSISLVKLALLYFLVAGNRWGMILNGPFDPERKERQLPFNVEGLTDFQISLLKKSLTDMDAFNRTRKTNAASLENRFREVSGIEIPRSPQDSDPVPMMLPVLIRDGRQRESVFSWMRKRGIGISRMYRSSLSLRLKGTFVNARDSFTGTEALAESLLLFPCHPFVPPDVLARMIDAIGSL